MPISLFRKSNRKKKGFQILKSTSKITTKTKIEIIPIQTKNLSLL